MAGSHHVQGRSRLSADALTGGAAESWDRRYDGRDADAHRARSRLDATVRILGPGPGDLLDVGAGGGRLIEALRGSWWTCHAVEPVERLVDLAAHRVPEAAARLAVARAE